MLIIKSLEKLDIEKNTSVALGNFDGLHVGHRRIMEDAIRSAKESGMKSLCFTFSNHPANYIMGRDDNDSDAVKLICSEEEKIRLIKEMGFDILVNIPFDEYIMNMDASVFFSDIILGKLNAACVSAGFNYSYGERATGNAETLKTECTKRGIYCNIQDAVKVDGKVVSSTLIREMISIGNMELTAKYLGRSYAFRGTVSHGQRLGSAMGIPTVNIPAPNDILLPPNGVYFSRIQINGKEFKSVSNLGVRPTVSNVSGLSVEDDKELNLFENDRESFKKNIETNIFDFNEDAYGNDVIIYFDHFSRGEVKFDSKEELFRQISRDRENAINYFRKI